MGFRSLRVRRKTRVQERLQRRRELRQTRRDLLQQMIGLAATALMWGFYAFLLWPNVRWLAAPFLVLGLFPFLILLSIVYRLLRGKHQVQIAERAMCNACETVTMPHHMKFHQLEGQECEGAGWVITDYSIDTEPATLRQPTTDGASMPTAGYGVGDRREDKRPDVEINWVVGAAVALALTVTLAGVYAWFTLASSVDFTDLRVGKCVEHAPSVSKIAAPDLVQVVDGAQPQAEEVYGRFRLNGRTYPGHSRVEELAWRGCDRLFEDYVGESPDDTLLEPYVFYPTENTWGDSRVVVCSVAGAGDTATSGSVRKAQAD